MKMLRMSMLVLGLGLSADVCHAQGFARGTQPSTPRLSSGQPLTIKQNSPQPFQPKVGMARTTPPVNTAPKTVTTKPTIPARTPTLPPKFVPPTIPTKTLGIGGQKAYIGPNAAQKKASDAFSGAYSNPSGFQIKSPTTTTIRQPANASGTGAAAGMAIGKQPSNITAGQQKVGQSFGNVLGNNAPRPIMPKNPVPDINLKGF